MPLFPAYPAAWKLFYMIGGASVRTRIELLTHAAASHSQGIAYVWICALFSVTVRKQTEKERSEAEEKRRDKENMKQNGKKSFSLSDLLG